MDTYSLSWEVHRKSEEIHDYSYMRKKGQVIMDVGPFPSIFCFLMGKVKELLTIIGGLE